VRFTPGITGKNFTSRVTSSKVQNGRFTPGITEKNDLFTKYHSSFSKKVPFYV
jgi:hypothetical protein